MIRLALPVLIFGAGLRRLDGHELATYTSGHPLQDADIVIGMEADWGVYNNIDSGSALVGFDVEFVGGMCELAGKKCAIVTVPWQSIIAKNYNDLGWDSNPKTYPGVGFNNGWFHCSSGTRNTIPRAQSLSFTHPYTDPTADTAGFLAKTGQAMAADASDIKVGMQSGYAVTAYFLANNGEGKKYNTPAADVTLYDTPTALYAALDAGDIHAVLTGTSDAADKIAEGGYEFIGDTIDDWANGVSFACHAGAGSAVAAMNEALVAYRVSDAYKTLCAAYPTVPCLGVGSDDASGDDDDDDTATGDDDDDTAGDDDDDNVGDESPAGGEEPAADDGETPAAGDDDDDKDDATSSAMLLTAFLYFA
jgi:ABC-type amino acid transport substrate-binding protein